MRQVLAFGTVESPFEKGGDSTAEFDLFWKEVLPEGVWKHPLRGFTLNVDKSRLDRLASNFKKQKELQIDVPIPSGHTYSEKENNGFVEDVEVRQRADGKSALYALTRITNKDAVKRINDGTTKGVSISFDPNKKHALADGKIAELGECLEHVALTSYPVISGMGDFIKFDTANEVVAVTQLSLVTDEEVPKNNDAIVSKEQLQQFAVEIANKVLEGVNNQQHHEPNKGENTMPVTAEQLRSLEKKFGFAENSLTEENWFETVNGFTPEIPEPPQFDITKDTSFVRLQEQNTQLLLDRDRRRHKDIVNRLKAAQSSGRIDKAIFDRIVGEEGRLQFSSEVKDFDSWANNVEARLEVIEMLPEGHAVPTGRVTNPTAGNFLDEENVNEEEQKKLDQEISEAIGTTPFRMDNIVMDPSTGLFTTKQ